MELALELLNSNATEITWTEVPTTLPWEGAWKIYEGKVGPWIVRVASAYAGRRCVGTLLHEMGTIKPISQEVAASLLDLAVQACSGS